MELKRFLCKTAPFLCGWRLLKQGDLAANWPGIAARAAATHWVNREESTPEPGGVGATCRKNWARLLFSLTPTPQMTRPFSPFHAWVTVPSPSGSLFYSKATWWAHVPEGPSTQRFTFSTAHIVWARDDQTRNPGKERELFCPKGRGTW